MKTWKRLISGLFALVLLASLAGSALAAEEAKKEAPKPAGQFSQWFSEMGVNPEDPKASEAVLVKMGTVINQTKTVGGETLTLNGAVWDGGSVRLSLTAKSPNLPKVVDQYTWLNSDGCTARMPEAQWKAYVENKVERESGDLSKEKRDEWFQYLMEQGQGQMELNPGLGVVSREGDAVQLSASMILDAYLEKPEITLHIGNVEITGQGMEQPGTRAGDYLLKGPFDFTFTLDQRLSAMGYTGGMPVTYGKVPLRITKVSISPTGMSTSGAIDIQGPVNLVGQRTKPVSGGTNVDLDKDLKLALNGLWTKDGKYVDCTASQGATGVLTPADNKNLSVNWSRHFPYPIDPAAVTAVDIGGTRVELAEQMSEAGRTAQG